MRSWAEEQAGPRAIVRPPRARVRGGDPRRAPGRRRASAVANSEHEVALATYAHFADRDPLTRAVLERMLAASRRGASDPPRSRSAIKLEAEASSTSKSAVSREFRRAHAR